MNFSKLNQALSCCSCKKLFTNQIFLCPSGHSSCSFCKSKNPTCIICRKRIENLRNILAEEIISSTFYTCPYCERSMGITQAGVHSNKCGWKCLICDSDQNSHRAAIKHLEVKHNIEFTASSPDINIILKEGKKIFGYKVGKLKIVILFNMESTSKAIAHIANYSKNENIKFHGRFNEIVIDKQLEYKKFSRYKCVKKSGSVAFMIKISQDGA